MLIPHLVHRLEAIALGIAIEILGIPDDLPTAFQRREFDLAVADAWTLRDCKCQTVLFTETFTCLVRQHHPRIGQKLTLEHYLHESHALVTSRGRVTGKVDLVLENQNLQRHVRVTLPHVLAVPAVIASTDLIVTIATRIADRFAENHSLKAFVPPISLDGFDVAMAWQLRMTDERAIQWLRNELVAVAQLITDQANK